MRASATAQGRKPSDIRLAEAHREETVLVVVIISCLVLMPIKAFYFLEALFYGVLLLCSLLLYIVASSHKCNTQSKTLLTVLGVTLFAYLAVNWYATNGGSADRLIQTFLFLCVLISLSQYTWNESRLRMLRAVFGFLILINLSYWFMSGRIVNYYSGIYGHANGFANVIVCALCVEMLVYSSSKEKKLRIFDFVFFASCIALLLFANSRASLLATALLFLVFAILVLVGKRGGLARISLILFFCTLLIVLVFSVVYPSLYGTELGRNLEALSRDLLNKNFFSGREVVWNIVLESLSGNELFGLGVTMTPSDLYNTGYSSHNLYLQTILQSGILGLMLLVAILFVAVRQLSRDNNMVSYVGIALIICLLFHECFEVTLTQNNFAYGLMYWALLAISLSAGEEYEGESGC